MTRRTRQQTAQIVVDAAVDLVRTEGIGLGVESLTYTRVFRHLEATTGQRVTRASVHERVWADQADFQAAVRDRLAGEAVTLDLRAGNIAVEAASSQLDGTGCWEQRLADALTTALATDALADGEEPIRQAGAVIRAMLAHADEAQREEAADSVDALGRADARRRSQFRMVCADAVERLGGTLRPSVDIELDQALDLAARTLHTISEGSTLVRPFDEADSDLVDVSLRGVGSGPWPLSTVVSFGVLATLFDFS